MKTRVYLTVAGIVGCLATLGLGRASLGDTATWTTSDLDTWVYENATSPGTHQLAPTFTGGETINQSTEQFNPSTLASPARLATVLYAFNTGAKITAGISASRYQINSVTMKATLTYDSDPNHLMYTDAPVSQQQILNDALSGNGSREKPIELYGAGLRAGYTGYEFGGGTSGPPLVDEGTNPYNTSNGGSYVYPIVGSSSQAGAYVDVSNSFTGGYSETDPTHNTAPFTPTPWAIGKTGLAVGDEIPDNTTFSFSLDLTAPGVISYVQQSLASGALGLMVSTLTPTTQFGAAGGYPRWYTKESANFPYFEPASRMPQLQIDYTILPPVQGDYNGDGVVDAADYVLWRSGGPLQNEVASLGVVDAQDYTAWRSLFGNTAASGSGLSSGSSAVPEPSSCVSLVAGVLFLGWTQVGRNRVCVQ